MTASLLLLLFLQDPDAQIRKAMEPSLEKQKASVSRQAPPAGKSSWFTFPWPSRPIEPLGPEILPAAATAEAKADCDPMDPAKLNPLIDAAAAREGIGADLIRAVMERESAFRPCAVSAKGAQGLMQLMPATAAELGVKDPFDPAESVAGGAKLLKQLMAKYKGKMDLVLGAYNAGEARVDAAGGVPPIAETQQYVDAIRKKLPETRTPAQ